MLNNPRAFVRENRRPAPCGAELKLIGFSLPTTMYDLVPIEPGIIAQLSFLAMIAPLRVIHALLPKWCSCCVKLWWELIR